MDANGDLLASADPEVDGYIEFTLYFRSFDTANPAPEIYWTGVSLASDGIPWTSDTPFIDGKGVNRAVSEVMTVQAANAARIGVFGDTTIIYERPDSETQLTVIGNSDLGEHSSTLNYNLTDANGSVDYYFAKNPAGPAGVATVTVPATIHNQTGVDELDATALLTLADIGTVGDKYEGSVTIRIWIEGWDPDCFNAILRDQLSIGLVFSTVHD
jgi:hypothetical protein